MPNETNAATVPPVAAATQDAATSPFYVVQQAVSENGKTYLKNQKILLTDARAQALGAMVRPWSETYLVNTDALTLGTATHKRGDQVSVPRDVALQLGAKIALPPAPQAVPATPATASTSAPVNTVPQPPAPATGSKPAMTVVPAASVTPPATNMAAKTEATK